MSTGLEGSGFAGTKDVGIYVFLADSEMAIIKKINATLCISKVHFLMDNIAMLNSSNDKLWRPWKSRETY